MSGSPAARLIRDSNGVQKFDGMPFLIVPSFFGLASVRNWESDRAILCSFLSSCKSLNAGM